MSASSILNRLRHKGQITEEEYRKLMDIKNMAKHKAQQEPCEDAISREAVLRVIDGWYEQNRDTENIEDLIILITYMGSVQPSHKEQEIKYWIDYYGHVTPLVQPSRKVIEDIKQEIAEYKDDKIIHAERNEMIDIALEIIDKHIK